jgi:hypothetical protein
MRLRRRGHVNYDIVDDDNQYFSRLEGRSEVPRRASTARGRLLKEKTEADLGREYAKQQASESTSYALA